MDKWFGKTRSAQAILWRFAMPKACAIYCSITSETLVWLLYCSEKFYSSLLVPVNRRGSA